jgi:hypothetical protein
MSSQLRTRSQDRCDTGRVPGRRPGAPAEVLQHEQRPTPVVPRKHLWTPRAMQVRVGEVLLLQPRGGRLVDRLLDERSSSVGQAYEPPRVVGVAACNRSRRHDRAAEEPLQDVGDVPGHCGVRTPHFSRRMESADGFGCDAGQPVAQPGVAAIRRAVLRTDRTAADHHEAAQRYRAPPSRPASPGARAQEPGASPCARRSLSAPGAGDRAARRGWDSWRKATPERRARGIAYRIES